MNKHNGQRRERSLKWVVFAHLIPWLDTGGTFSEFNLVCDQKFWLSTSKSVYMLGLGAGVVAMGIVADKFGRRMTTVISNLLVLIFGCITALSPNVVVFIILRFLTALFVLPAYTNAFVIVLELVPSRCRTCAGITGAYVWSFWYMFVGLLGYLIRDWRILQFVGSATALPNLLLFCFLPESPRWLISQNRDGEAGKILKMITSINKYAPGKDKPSPDSNPLNAELKTSADQTKDKQAQATLKDILSSPRMRTRFVICAFCWFVCSMVYYGVALNAQQLSGSIFMNFVVSGLVEQPAHLFAQIGIMSPLGRRWTFLVSFLLAGVALFISGFLKKGTMTLTVLAHTGKFGISSAFTIAYMFTAELFPTILRSVSLGASSMCARLGSILSPQLMFLGTSIAQFTFGTCGLIAACAAFFLPETLLRALPETLDDGENFGKDHKLFSLVPLSQIRRNKTMANFKGGEGTELSTLRRRSDESDSLPINDEGGGYDEVDNPPPVYPYNPRESTVSVTEKNSYNEYRLSAEEALTFAKEGRESIC